MSRIVLVGTLERRLCNLAFLGLRQMLTLAGSWCGFSDFAEIRCTTRVRRDGDSKQTLYLWTSNNDNNNNNNNVRRLFIPTAYRICPRTLKFGGERDLQG